MAETITVRVDRAKLDKIIAHLPGASDKAVGEIAYAVQGDAQASFGSGPDGQTYGIHVASSPGFPPNTDKENLINSAYTKQRQRGTWEVGFMAAYAAALEFGTPHIAPRPFLYPAVQRAFKTFAQKFGAIFK